MKARHAILLSTAANIGIAALGAVTGVLAARALGPEQRGYLAAVMAWFSISLVLSELGQSAAVTFFVAKNSARSAAYIITARKIMFVGSIVVGGLGLVFADLLAGGDAQASLAYRIVFAGTLINALCAPMVYALQSLAFGRWNIVRLSQPAFYVICLISLYLTGALTLTTAALSTIVSLVGQLIVAWVLLRLTGLGFAKPTRMESAELKSYGAAQAAYAIPASLTEQYDRVVLSWCVDAYQLGQYAVALTVSQASRSLGTAIASVVFPMSAKLGNAESSRIALERRSLWATALASGVGLLLIGWLAQPLVPVLFGEDFRDALPLIWLLVPVMWLRGINSLIAVFLRGRQHPFYATTGQLLSLIVGASLLIILAPGLGLMAAPLGFFFGEATAVLVNIFYLRAARRLPRKLAGSSLSAPEPVAPARTPNTSE